MSQQILRALRNRLAAESGAVVKPWGGRLSMALCYPNTYHQGMSNLGFQSVYQQVNADDQFLCERFFLPDPVDLDEHRRTGFPLVSLENQRPLADFDLVAFSISFENDYLNLPKLFELGRIPLWRVERSERHPLVLAGGVCAFLNPEPLADIMDLFAVGEAEVILPALLPVLLGQDLKRWELLKRLGNVPGLYIPAGYEIGSTSKGDPAMQNPLPGFPQRVKRQYAPNLDAGQAKTCIATTETEFGSMNLVEASRGCPRGCRFCAAGYIYLPFREHSGEHLRREILSDLKNGDKVGLVAAAVTDYGDLAELGESILQQGGEVSVSSVRIDAVTPEQVKMLAASGHKTIALAPEAGSQRLRDVINKGIDQQQILAAVNILAGGGIPNLKLYFMVGLPTETDVDIEELIDLVKCMRDEWEQLGRRRGRLGRLILSINPFVPKPFTPLQWSPMEPKNSLEKKCRRLKKELGRLPNVEINFESLRSAELQGALSRGDRALGKILPLLASGSNLRAACKELGLDYTDYLYREREQHESFPWEIVDVGVTREFLWKEYRAALAARPGTTCRPGCKRCGVC
ncbi:MAG: radical SAM protein [Desulfuromonas sp.]|nr:MAG: radical SAM protein [Desulfuromonas sp.]